MNGYLRLTKVSNGSLTAHVRLVRFIIDARRFVVQVFRKKKILIKLCLINNVEWISKGRQKYSDARCNNKMLSTYVQIYCTVGGSSAGASIITTWKIIIKWIKCNQTIVQSWKNTDSDRGGTVSPHKISLQCRQIYKINFDWIKGTTYNIRYHKLLYGNIICEYYFFIYGPLAEIVGFFQMYFSMHLKQNARTCLNNVGSSDF